MTNESLEISDSDIQQLIDSGEAPQFHPILEVWREVLKPARKEMTAKVSPQWANRIVTQYFGLQYADMENFRDVYFGKLIQLMDILDEEIAADGECLSPTTPEEDAEQNSLHYKNLLMNWQLAILQWELDWHCADPQAAVELAAISEVHKMFFGREGLTAFLDNIAFQYTEDDQAMLAEALTELKEGR